MRQAQYNKEVLLAIKEAKELSKNPYTKKYSSFKEAFEDL